MIDYSRERLLGERARYLKRERSWSDYHACSIFKMHAEATDSAELDLYSSIWEVAYALARLPP